MINLAIVVAVAEYSNGLNSLPGCKQDGEAISCILTNESRFIDVLIIDSNTSSKSVKTRIVEFATKHKNEEIGDFVFYYTGYGGYDKDDFYYLLSDYRKTRRNSTALQNSELDDSNRSHSPVHRSNDAESVAVRIAKQGLRVGANRILRLVCLTDSTPT